MKLLSLFLFLFFLNSAQSQYQKEIIVEPVLKTDTNSIGQKIIYPAFPDPEITVLKITIEPGKSTGWHKHEIPVFAYILEGSLTVEVENHKSLTYSSNGAYPEVLNVYHNGINRTQSNVVLLAFYMGQKGKKLAIMK